MIRITENFTLRRIAGQLEVYVPTIATTLNASQARHAAEAFNVMAVMMDGSNNEDETDAKVLELETAA